LAWRRRAETPCRIEAVEILIRGSPDPGLCSRSCPTGALRVEDGRLVAEPGACVVCIACMAVCGPDVVEVVPRWVCPGEDEAAGEPV
jgi:ferredoxin